MSLPATATHDQRMRVSRERRDDLLRHMPAEGWVTVVDLTDTTAGGDLWHPERSRRMGELRAALHRLLLAGVLMRERDPWASGYRWRRINQTRPGSTR